MPASFLHGVETIEITKGARTITTVKTAVVGIVVVFIGISFHHMPCEYKFLPALE